jgi:hypothetical protein
MGTINGDGSIFASPFLHIALFDVGNNAPRPRSKALKEVLDWLDRYLGPVK